VPEKGTTYKKSDIVDNLSASERMAATYFDPPRDTLCTFINEGSEGSENIYQDNTLRFRPRSGEHVEDPPPWERTKVRHVFLRRTGHTGGGYEYLGSAIDEKRISRGGHEWIQYELQ
jgi:hypothetical protein